MLTNKVSALVREYPEFGNGNTILFDNTNTVKCNTEYYLCYSYIIPEDDGINDDEMRMTNIDDPFKQRSVYDYGVNLNKNDKIITLSS